MEFELKEIWAQPYARAAIVVAGGVVAAVLADLLTRLLARLASRTRTEIDDKIVGALRRPVFWSVVFAASGWAVDILELPRPAPYVIFGLLKTMVVLLWAVAVSRTGAVLLGWLSERNEKQRPVSRLSYYASGPPPPRRRRE